MTEPIITCPKYKAENKLTEELESLNVLNNESNRSQFATLKSGRDKDTFLTTLANKSILSSFPSHDWKKGCVSDMLCAVSRVF